MSILKIFLFCISILLTSASQAAYYGDEYYYAMQNTPLTDKQREFLYKNEYAKQLVGQARLNEALKLYLENEKNLDSLGLDGFASDNIKARTYSNLSTVYSMLIEYDKSVLYLNKSLNLKINMLKKYPNLDKSPFFMSSLMLAYNAKATFLGNVGNYEKAEEYYIKAEKIYDNFKGRINSGNIESLFRNQGNNFLSLKNYDQSIKYFKKALEINQRGSEHYIAGLYLRLAEAYSKKGDFEEALNYIDKSIDDLKSYSVYGIDENNKVWFGPYMTKGDVYLEMKDFEKAKENFEIAKKFAFRNFDVLNINLKIIECMYGMGKEKEVFDEYEKNIDELITLVTGMSNKIGTENYESLYSSEQKRILLFFDRLNETVQNEANVSAYHPNEKEAINKAFNMLIRFKGSANDFENTIYRLTHSGENKELKQEIDHYIFLKRSYAKHLQSPSSDLDSVDAYNQRKTSLEKQISELEPLLAQKANGLRLINNNVNTSDLINRLSDKELYLDFLATDKAYYVFVLDNKNNITFQKIANQNDVENAVADFRADIDNIIKDKHGKLTSSEESELLKRSNIKLQKLYDLLIKPVEAVIAKKERLIISPDGILNLIPFEALYVDGKYLIQGNDIVYTPSAKDYLRNRSAAKKKKSNVHLTIFANPNYSYKQKQEKSDVEDTYDLRGSLVLRANSKMYFEPLPGSKLEAENVKKILKGEKKIVIHEGDQCTENQLLNLQSPQILHVAAHGFFLNDNTTVNPMLLSGIALSGANTSLLYGKDDGIVTALKLSGMDLSNTDLVVLSACDTGRGVIKAGNGVAGLNKALISAGAKNIVMSLWSVSDSETVDLMTGFYKKSKNKSYSESLKETKVEMIKMNRHPFFWSSFILSGK